jgi:hypothetical protein
MIDAYDFKHTGKLDFEEFRSMMLGPSDKTSEEYHSTYDQITQHAMRDENFEDAKVASHNAI